MTSLIFWLWAPGVLLTVAAFGLYLTKRDKVNPGE